MLNGLSVSESFVGLPTEGGSVDITVKSDAAWEIKSAPRWVTVSPKNGSAGETKVSFSVLQTKKQRSGEAVIASEGREQHIEFIQAYVSEGSTGPREFIKVDKVQPNKLYLIVFEVDGKSQVLSSLTTAGNSGGYDYGYGSLTALTADEISADKKKITLNHQDYSLLLKASGDAYTMRFMSSNLYFGNNGGYSSISHGDENVPGSLWKFTFLEDGTAKVQTGSMWMHYSSKYGNIELTAADPAGDIPAIYEDTQDPELDELIWGDVTVASVTAKSADFSASFAYNGIEPLDGAGFIVKTDDEDVEEDEFKIELPINNSDTRFTASTDKLVAGVDYTVTAYLNYEGLTMKSEPVPFTTKAAEAKTIKVAEFVELLKEMEIESNTDLSTVPVDFVEGIVTAINGKGQNLYKGMTVEDGTGEPNTGIFLYANAYNNAFEPGTKVKLSLADAVATSYNGLLQITEGTLEKVSEGNQYTLAKFSADTVDFADYVGMYVTVVDAKCTSEVGTVWNDGASSNAYVDFTSNDGKVEFSAKTYKTSPWAKEIVGVKSVGNISGVVQVSKGDYSILPNKAEDVAAFANTDPEIKSVSETSVSWDGRETDAVVLKVTGDRLKGLTAGVDNAHWTVTVSGNDVTVTPNEMNLGDDKITAVLTINAIGGNSAEVALTHIPAEPLPEFTSGKYWIVANGKVAMPLTSNYGYLKVANAAADNTSTQANLFTFTAVEGGFTIQDPSGKYYYQTGTYNSFNVQASLPSNGGVWTVEPQYDGTFIITNASVKKYIQLDSQYGTYGSYNTVKGTLPVLVAAEGGNQGGSESGPATAELSFASKDQRTSFSTSQQVWEQNGIKFINDKASSTNNVADYANPVRCYKGSNITVEKAGMTKVVFTCGSADYAKALNSSITGATPTLAGSAVTVEFSSAVSSFEVKNLSAQVRISSISVTYNN